jgi:hypothetical protein
MSVVLLTQNGDMEDEAQQRFALQSQLVAA